jgi:hypothetical protein
MANYLDKSGLLRVLRGVKNQIERKVGELETTKGRPNGIASLDSKGFVPLAQLGNLDMNFFEAVQELPTKDIKKHIYLIKNTKEGEQDTYDEYLYTGDIDGEYDASKWEKLGDFVPTFDLKEYAKKKDAVNSISIRDIGNSSDAPDNFELGLYYINGDGEEKCVTIPTVTVGGVSTHPSGALRPYTGHNGLMTSEDKAKLDKIDTEALSQSITAANTAAGNTNEAIRKCETATAGAERCNVTLEGTKIIVTNREGEKQETEVVNTEEVVTVVITSSVESISVAGLKVNVFLNSGKTPQTYTTDSEGKTTFKVSRGVYYQVAVPEYANAQPLSPIGFTSVGVSKTITFNYEPYDEETSEKVIVTVTKYTDGTGAPWEGKDVIVTIDKKATTYTTDEKGQATIYVPYLKEYTVRVDDEDGYYVRFNKNSRTYTSRVAQRLIQVNMYQFKTGIYVLDSDATEYYIEDWVAAGKTAEEAIAIRVADQNLRLNRGTFIIRCTDLKDMTKLQKYQWCTQNLQFTSIALNGNTSSDPNYWNGEQSSFLVRQEAEDRSLSVPAFAFAYGQSLEIGGEKLNGFLMSVGQEYVHISNAGTIREVLRTLFGDSVADAYYKFVNGQTRWTSTQYSATLAWSYNSQALSSYKTNSSYVLPVFAC